jgi:hypothetical protein
MKRNLRGDAEGPKTYKRIRMMSGDSSGSQATLPHASDSLNDSQKTDSYSLPDSQNAVDLPLSPSEKTSVEFLQAKFPTLPMAVGWEMCHNTGSSRSWEKMDNEDNHFNWPQSACFVMLWPSNFTLFHSMHTFFPLWNLTKGNVTSNLQI